ncbi:MAG: Panacea domain-containing protein [Candidatus Staskawiczbacteria bacterium]|nr:Panacea domain-containing protein [Candidatus Staskawiczbacteria bacterium]
MVKINEKKYKNLILFFANKIRNGTLGKLKIMKLMYFLDFDYFEKYGKSISGDEYLRYDLGPVPRTAKRILEKMDGKDIRITKKKIGLGYNDQQLIEPIKDFDVKLFSKEELLMMEEIAGKWEKFSGTDMKNASHGEAPWIATKPNDVIDYNLAYYRNKYGEMSNM